MKIEFKSIKKSFTPDKLSPKKSAEVQYYFVFIIDNKILLVALAALERYLSGL